MPIRHGPTGQDGERRATQRAESAPYPYAVVLLVVRRLAPLSVPDDRRNSTHGTPTGHLLQADPGYPGAVLSSAAGNEIKRIMAGVKACHWVLPARILRRPAFTFLAYSVSNEKKNTAFLRLAAALYFSDWPVYAAMEEVVALDPVL
jgi:hypothetical protein